MKLEKLLTLSQFVDELSAKGSYQSVWPIYKYNNFLKQPLTKEMFVNLVSMPNEDDYQGIIPFTDKEDYSESLLMCLESEKKEIFKDAEFKNIKNGSLGNYTEWYYFGEYRYSFQTKTLETKCDKHGNYAYFENIITLYDLSGATKGAIEIKNVEI